MSSTLEDPTMETQVNNVSDSNVVKTKQPVWNKPSRDVAEVGSVMGDFSWPALSKSAKASPKSSSDSLKALSDGSVSAPQGSAVAMSPKMQTTKNTNLNSNQNHTFNRQKPVKRVETSQNSSSNPGQQPGFTDSRRGPHQRNNNFDGGPRGRFVSHPRPVNSNHPHQPNWSRRSYGGRQREQWNSHNRNGRDFETPHQPRGVVPINFMGPRPLSNPNPLVNGPSAVRPLTNPMPLPLYHAPGSLAPEAMRIMPFFPVPPFGPMYLVPHPDPQLRAQIIKQIDYYFSPDNLIKDMFLRGHMDKEGGWVSISLIAGFNKVKDLTNDIPFILDALSFSTVVEVQGDKIRKKNDWMKWLLTPSQGVGDDDMLANRMRNVGLEEGNSTNNNNTSTSLTETCADPVGRSSSENMNSHVSTSNGEGQG